MVEVSNLYCKGCPWVRPLPTEILSGVITYSVKCSPITNQPLDTNIPSAIDLVIENPDLDAATGYCFRGRGNFTVTRK